MTYAPELQ